jgi:hypothetical protein
MEAVMMEGKVNSWNDDRLDELNRRVESGFATVEERFVRLEGEMKEGFAKVDERFVRLEGEMKGGFAKVDREMKDGFAELRGEMGYLGERFDRLLNTLALISWSFAGTLVAALAAVLVAAFLT